jgi:hypothetical protein
MAYQAVRIEHGLFEELIPREGRSLRIRTSGGYSRSFGPGLRSRDDAISLLSGHPTHVAPVDPFAAPERVSRSGSTSANRRTEVKRGPNLAEKAVREALEARGWTVHRGGLLDFIALRDDRLAFIEVKNRETKDRLSAEQRKVLADLRHRNVEEYVLDVYPSRDELVVWTIPGVPPVPFGQVFGV